MGLPNLHGDTAATAPDTTDNETTEYGAPRTAHTAPTTYGWLGTKHRSTADLAGLILMGVRLYDPGTGRFLSVDAAAGGNDDAYVYPSDPINSFDLNGQWGSTKWLKKQWKAIAVTAAVAAVNLVPGAEVVDAELVEEVFYIARAESGLDYVGPSGPRGASPRAWPITSEMGGWQKRKLSRPKGSRSKAENWQDESRNRAKLISVAELTGWTIR